MGRDRRRALRALTPGHVLLESVEHRRRECWDRRDPETLCIEAQERCEQQGRNARHMTLVTGLSSKETIAVTLADGLFGQRVHSSAEVGSLLGVSTYDARVIIETARRRVEQLRTHADDRKASAP